MATLEEAEIDDNPDLVDSGKAAHDKVVIRTMRDQAIHNMKEKGCEIGPDDEKMALSLFPRVFFLATCLFSTHHYFAGCWPC